jgi:hypothetical protein
VLKVAKKYRVGTQPGGFKRSMPHAVLYVDDDKTFEVFAQDTTSGGVSSPFLCVGKNVISRTKEKEDSFFSLNMGAGLAPNFMTAVQQLMPYLERKSANHARDQAAKWSDRVNLSADDWAHRLERSEKYARMQSFTKMSKQQEEAAARSYERGRKKKLALNKQRMRMARQAKRSRASAADRGALKRKELAIAIKEKKKKKKKQKSKDTEEGEEEKTAAAPAKRKASAKVAASKRKAPAKATEASKKKKPPTAAAKKKSAAALEKKREALIQKAKAVASDGGKGGGSTG